MINTGVKRGAMLLSVLLMTALLAPLASAAPHEVEENEFYEELSRESEDEHGLPVEMEMIQHLKFELEHQLSADAPFTSRGVVEIVSRTSSLKPQVSFSMMSTLSSEDVAKLDMLLRQGHHYIVRAKADPHDPASPYAMTSVPMCMLAATQMREHFAFHLSDNGKLVAIEYLTPYLEPETCAVYQTRSLSDVSLDPVGTVLKPQHGPSPPKTVVIKHDRAPQGVKPVRNEDANTEVEPESQSFLRKYWYVILPMVVMSLFGGNGGDAPAGGAPAPAAAGRRR
uniref:ER membrane protein complex subunit 10 n=1 Tax=Peronospora matthiolae TaxID=2874970 RepID=A0AAV1VER5_9STRA